MAFGEICAWHRWKEGERSFADVRSCILRTGRRSNSMLLESHWVGRKTWHRSSACLGWKERRFCALLRWCPLAECRKRRKCGSDWKVQPRRLRQEACGWSVPLAWLSGLGSGTSPCKDKFQATSQNFNK